MTNRNDMPRAPIAPRSPSPSRRWSLGTFAGGLGIACAAAALIAGVLFVRPVSEGAATFLAFLWFFASLAAIGCGAVGLLWSRHRAGAQRRATLAALVLGGVLLCLCLRVAPRKLSQYSARVPCAENLNRIGLALGMYAEANGGRYPADIESLAISGAIEPKDLICPDGDDTPAKGTTPAALAAELRQPGHVSFIYLGKGKRAADFTADDVLAYDRPKDHNGEGSNVLCGDYHTEWVPAGLLSQMLARPLPATRPVPPATSQGGL